MSTKCIPIIIIITLLFTTACSSKYTDSIDDIKESKLQEQRQEIKISTSSDFTVYIDRSDRIKYICKNNNLYNYSDGKCGYYNKSKHSYENLIVQEEVFGISKDGYAPLRMPYKTKCGTGSFHGWLAISMMEPFAIKNYTAKDKEGCGYRYTKLDNTLITQRVIGGIYTFGTSFITAANLHTREFAEEAFKDSIHNSKIYLYKDEIYRAIEGYKIDGGFNFISLRKGSYKSDLADAYKVLLHDKTKKAGFLLLDYDSKNLISIVIFDKYKELDLISSLSLQIGDILALKNSKKPAEIKRYDIIARLPATINPPKLPTVPILVQSEYETSTAFDKRVQDAKLEREASIKNMQKEYSSSILQRNRYIDKLQTTYQEYLDDTADIQYEIIKELHANIQSLAKVLFLGNISGYEAKEFNYNAETKQLFFNISSKTRGYSQDVVAKVPSLSAKNIKENSSFLLLPDIVNKDSTLELKGFQIIDTLDNESYSVCYTDINYKSPKVEVKIATKKEMIDKEVSLAFKNAKQKQMPTIDTATQVIWYKDGSSREDARKPVWFLKPHLDDNIRSQGEGNTLIDAINSAIGILSMKLNGRVYDLFESKEVVTNFKTTTKTTHTSKYLSEAKLNAGDYKVYRQEELDSRWYVELLYMK